MQTVCFLTSLQQYTAVTDIYFIIRKVQPYLVSVGEVGGDERGGQHVQNWCPKGSGVDPTSQMVELFLPGVGGSRGSSVGQLSGTPLWALRPHSWVSGGDLETKALTLSLSPVSYSEGRELR